MAWFGTWYGSAGQAAASAQEIAEAVWQYSNRTLSLLGAGLADEVWNRMRLAVNRPVGSFGYYLDTLVSMAGQGASLIEGPHQVVLRFVDGQGSPVPNTLFVLQSADNRRGLLITDGSGRKAISLIDGSYSVYPYSTSEVFFPVESFSVSGNMEITVRGSARVDTLEHSICLFSTRLVDQYRSPLPNRSVVLSVVSVPGVSSNTVWRPSVSISVSTDSSGVSLFGMVPVGMLCTVSVPDFGWSQQLTIPSQHSYQLTAVV